MKHKRLRNNLFLSSQLYDKKDRHKKLAWEDYIDHKKFV